MSHHVKSTFRSTLAFRWPQILCTSNRRGLLEKLKAYVFQDSSEGRPSSVLRKLSKVTVTITSAMVTRLLILGHISSEIPPTSHHCLFFPYPLFLEWRINQAGIVTGLSRWYILTRLQWLRAFVVNCSLFTALNHEGACFVWLKCSCQHANMQTESL